MLFSLWRFIFIIGALLILLCMFGMLTPKTARLKQAGLNMATGFAAMLLINLTLSRFGIRVPVNLLSIAAAAGFGAPGVALTAALYAVF